MSFCVLDKFSEAMQSSPRSFPAQAAVWPAKTVHKIDRCIKFIKRERDKALFVFIPADIARTGPT